MRWEHYLCVDCTVFWQERNLEEPLATVFLGVDNLPPTRTSDMFP
jgi:hypothetical protein